MAFENLDGEKVLVVYNPLDVEKDMSIDGIDGIFTIIAHSFNIICIK